jgi:uncharacterized membrane protein (UPF0127 family)
MKIFKKILPFIVLILFLLVLIFLNKTNQKIIYIKDIPIKVTLAQSETQKTKGLSGVKKLAEGKGMLFVFDKMQQNNFWMKDMNFPLDIIYFNEKKEIVLIEENVTPETFPNTFGGDMLSMYVLEVNAGFVAKNNITIGNTFSFDK